MPPGEKAPPQGGGGPAKGGEPSGEEIAKKLEELISGQRKEGGSIPTEIEELVKMIPL